MQLYLIRHAIAVERDEADVQSDASRALTPEGVKKMRRNAKALRKLDAPIDAVWTSPLVRAVQTAEILAAEFSIASRLRTVEALRPDGSFETITAELRLSADSPGIALVGHEPFLGEFASYLLTGSRAAEIEFKKGGVACFEIADFGDPFRARLRWLLTPRQMSELK